MNEKEETGIGLTGLEMTRRKMLGGASVAALGIFGGGLLFGGAAASPARPAIKGLALDQELPADAAAPDQQTLMAPADGAHARFVDIFLSVYDRPSDATSDVFSEPLVRLDKNFQILPAAATEWTGSEDGKTWTFKLREDMTWSDGNPVTAADFVATFRQAADPAFAWDFTGYFKDVLKNWTQVINGELTPDQLGVNAGANEFEVVFETETAAPYLPAMLLYSTPLSAAALAASGPLYNTDPATAVSSGPFIVTEWSADQQIVLSKNEKYTGSLPALLNKFVIKLSAPENFFIMYQNNEIDFMVNPDPASIAIMQSDENTAKEIYQGVGDFPTFHIFFDVTKAPFDNLKVRQAWSHAIDRDTLYAVVLGPNGIPAYSWLAPGFPASNTEGLKEIQKFDPELGQSLLAEAGYPDGKDFPKQQLWLRAPSPLDKTVAGALVSMLKENLNVDVELLEKDQPGFMDALLAKPTEILLGYLRYGMDFFDPFNMLSLWLSGVRYSWVNEDYDRLVKSAAEFLGSEDDRTALFQDAERILVEDVPAVFVYHGTQVQLNKPWMKGPFLEPDENGIQAMHWPGYTTMSTVPAELYIGADAPER